MEQTIPSGEVSLLSAEVEVDIPFHDLDGMAVVWHGHYYKYFEHARIAAMRTIGLDLDLDTLVQSGYVWPVIESHCRYISPLKFGMRVLVRAVLEDCEHRLRFSYLVKDKLSGRRLAKGHTVQVAVDMAKGTLCLNTPAVLLERLRSHGY